MGQTEQSLTCSIMEKPHTGLGNVRESYSRALEQGTLMVSRHDTTHVLRKLYTLPASRIRNSGIVHSCAVNIGYSPGNAAQIKSSCYINPSQGRGRGRHILTSRGGDQRDVPCLYLATTTMACYLVVPAVSGCD